MISFFRLKFQYREFDNSHVKLDFFQSFNILILTLENIFISMVYTICEECSGVERRYHHVYNVSCEYINIILSGRSK